MKPLSAPQLRNVAVVGHKAWLRKFRGDPSVLGRTIRIDAVPVTIVGVGPAGHNGTINVGIVTDFWLPIASLPVLGAPPRTLERRPDEAGSEESWDAAPVLRSRTAASPLSSFRPSSVILRI